MQYYSWLKKYHRLLSHISRIYRIILFFDCFVLKYNFLEFKKSTKISLSYSFPVIFNYYQPRIYTFYRAYQIQTRDKLRMPLFTWSAHFLSSILAISLNASNKNLNQMSFYNRTIVLYIKIVNTLNIGRISCFLVYLLSIN